MSFFISPYAQYFFRQAPRKPSILLLSQPTGYYQLGKPMPKPAVTPPYFGQWESSQLIGQFIRQELSSDKDPNWAQSGAKTITEYATWARHICGMACLKMVLAATQNRTYPTLTLMRLTRQYGGYIETHNDIKGLIYAPFVSMVEKEFALRARVVTHINTADIRAQLHNYNYFMASVHPTIRHPKSIPPTRGGHLVLVTQIDNQQGVTFHNPSGDKPINQKSANVSIDTFTRFFAGRGIALGR
jgi:hypothetical protein